MLPPATLPAHRPFYHRPLLRGQLIPVPCYRLDVLLHGIVLFRHAVVWVWYGDELLTEGTCPLETPTIAVCEAGNSLDAIKA